jgi:hypothetical protein
VATFSIYYGGGQASDFVSQLPKTENLMEGRKERRKSLTFSFDPFRESLARSNSRRDTKNSISETKIQPEKVDSDGDGRFSAHTLAETAAANGRRSVSNAQDTTLKKNFGGDARHSFGGGSNGCGSSSSGGRSSDSGNNTGKWMHTECVWRKRVRW